MDPNTIINLITSYETAINGLDDAINSVPAGAAQTALKLQRQIFLAIVASLRNLLQNGPNGAGWPMTPGPSMGAAVAGKTEKKEDSEVEGFIVESLVGILGHLIGGLIGGIIAAPIGLMLNPAKVSPDERIVETGKYRVGNECFKVEWYQAEGSDDIRVRIAPTPC